MPERGSDEVHVRLFENAYSTASQFIHFNKGGNDNEARKKEDAFENEFKIQFLRYQQIIREHKKCREQTDLGNGIVTFNNGNALEGRNDKGKR